MNILLICLILTMIIVYVYDFVGFPRLFLAHIYSIIFKRNIAVNRIKLPKLLECSLCCVQWVTLLLLAIFNWKLIPFSFIFGWSTTHILTIFNIINNFITKILKKLYEYTY